jgi:hypothetical protein
VHSAESSNEEAGEDQSDTDLSTVTDLSDTRKQLEEELGNAALNSGSADKEKEGIKKGKYKRINIFAESGTWVRAAGC